MGRDGIIKKEKEINRARASYKKNPLYTIQSIGQNMVKRFYK